MVSSSSFSFFSVICRAPLHIASPLWVDYMKRSFSELLRNAPLHLVFISPVEELHNSAACCRNPPRHIANPQWSCTGWTKRNFSLLLWNPPLRIFWGCWNHKSPKNTPGSSENKYFIKKKRHCSKFNESKLHFFFKQKIGVTKKYLSFVKNNSHFQRKIYNLLSV